jgi:Uma2 family endonuclease
MATDTSRRLVTADELLRMPDDGGRYELVRGVLVRMSPTSSRSSLVSRATGTRVDRYVREHGLGICGDADWGFLLSSNPDIVRAPDVGVVVAARVPADGIPPGYWPGAPDLAIEVISPSDRFADVLEKVQEYLVAGTRLVWVLDPEARKAIVFRPGQPPETVGADGELSGADVLPGFVLRLAEVWV